ncbi:hypothetical protein [Hafnia paralvei]|uniref:hypothetical protein n=1 Tax=Hafnia paralvei TaxID=546367 RepID=UPI00300D6A51
MYNSINDIAPVLTIGVICLALGYLIGYIQKNELGGNVATVEANIAFHKRVDPNPDINVNVSQQEL